ncbi:MAG: methyltransferase domain-containing protein [Bryobacteraceae bacterium]|nr:methyltransferase domain-containing protein [Bryobacteraceae bacterium]
MHPAVFQLFDRICRERRAGGEALEIGATPTADTLLCLPALRGARTKIGVNLAPPTRFADFEIAQANANRLTLFNDASFDTVLCNAVLEHDPYFWLTLGEIRRVARRGALIAIGAPGYAKLPAERLAGRLSRLPLAGALFRNLAASTLTLQIHNFPGDYYRFSPQAMREVLLEGLADVEVGAVLTPPRVIGAGVKR